MLANHAGQLESVDLRHADIHEHDGYIGFQKVFERLFSGSRLYEVLIQFAEDGLIAQEFGRLIIHHQDVHPIFRTH